MTLRIIPLLLVMVSAAMTSEAVTIRGKIRNYDGKTEVRYIPTVEGVLVPFGTTVIPSHSGTFTIQFISPGYGTTIISFNRLVYRLFHKEDSEIFLEIDQEKIRFPKMKEAERRHFEIMDSVKQLTTVRIDGDFSDINNLYNKLSHTSFYTTRSVSGTHVSLFMQSKRTVPALMASHDSLVSLDLQKIDALSINVSLEDPHAQAESQFIKDFLKNEIRSFYGSNLLNSILLRRLAQFQQNQIDSTKNQDLYDEEWMRFVQEYSADLKSKLQSQPASRDYQELLHQLDYTEDTYRDLAFPQTMKKSLDQMAVDEIFNYNTSLYSDPKIVFAYQLDMLNRYIQDPTFYSPVLLHSMYALQEKYAESKAIRHYDQKIRELENYIIESNKDFSGATFINKRFVTLNDLIVSLKGQNLLIDVWATWCHPCIEDFRFKKDIQRFIDQGKLKVLYISLDKAEWSDRWKNSVRFNKLQGYNYRADEDFMKDLWATLRGLEGAIPRYALVNDQGKIVNASAPRPGDEGKLVKEIEAMVADN